MVQVTSGLADEIAKEMRINGCQAKVTRADWQVTTQREGKAQGYANTIRRRAREAISLHEANVPQTTVVYEGAGDSDSCYIRTGRGDSIFRAYHKTAESPGNWPLNTWRYELQLRGKRARGSFDMFRSAANSTWLSRSLVAGFMLQYGLEESWQMSDKPCPSPSRYEKSDTARRLAWWHSTVVAVAGRLIEAGVDVHDLTRPLLEKSYTAPRRGGSNSLKVYSSPLAPTGKGRKENGSLQTDASLLDVG